MFLANYSPIFCIEITVRYFVIIIIIQYSISVLKIITSTPSDGFLSFYLHHGVYSAVARIIW